MKKKIHFIYLLLASIGLALIAMLLVQLYYFIVNYREMPVLFPDGPIAITEKNLIYVATFLMLIVVIPVFILTVVFIIKYRESNTKAKYTPDWEHSPLAEFIWWGVPCIIVTIISIITYKYSYALDPYKPIESGNKTLKVQVIALDWKWLFIYPEQQVASVNFLQLPLHRPIHFEITADAPMNSFWLPALSGQIFAMPGMRTELHLVADNPGEFRGNSANISGEGFSGMRFLAKASSQEEFDEWVKKAAQGEALNEESYKLLALPSIDNPITTYSLEETTLFDAIVMKYMMPEHQHGTMGQSHP